MKKLLFIMLLTFTTFAGSDGNWVYGGYFIFKKRIENEDD